MGRLREAGKYALLIDTVPAVARKLAERRSTGMELRVVDSRNDELALRSKRSFARPQPAVEAVRC